MQLINRFDFEKVLTGKSVECALPTKNHFKWDLCRCDHGWVLCALAKKCTWLDQFSGDHAVAFSDEFQGSYFVLKQVPLSRKHVKFLEKDDYEKFFQFKKRIFSSSTCYRILKRIKVWNEVVNYWVYSVVSNFFWVATVIV